MESDVNRLGWTLNACRSPTYAELPTRPVSSSFQNTNRTERLVSIQSAALGDDLEFGLDDPADDFL